MKVVRHCCRSGITFSLKYKKFNCKNFKINQAMQLFASLITSSQEKGKNFFFIYRILFAQSDSWHFFINCMAGFGLKHRCLKQVNSSVSSYFLDNLCMPINFTKQLCPRMYKTVMCFKFCTFFGIIVD